MNRSRRHDASMPPFPHLKIVTDVRMPYGTILFTDHRTVLTTPQIERLLREQWMRSQSRKPILL